jgi:DNA-binding NarL/FixJ family response regulator
MTAQELACVVLADERPLARAALRDALEPRFRVAAALGSARGLLAAVRRCRPVALVLSMALPGADLFELLRELSGPDHGVPVLLLAPSVEPFVADQALRAGAHGYLLRDATPAALLDAVDTVATGGVVIDALLYRRSADDGWGIETTVAPSASARALTVRQRQVLRLVVQGRRSAEIATSLGISEKAVEFHRGRIKRALGVSTTAGLVRYAVTRGLLRSDGPRRSIPA